MCSIKAFNCVFQGKNIFYCYFFIQRATVKKQIPQRHLHSSNTLHINGKLFMTNSKQIQIEKTEKRPVDRFRMIRGSAVSCNLNLA